MNRHRVSYGVDGYAASEVKEGKSLAIELDASSSPLLFGCRTGVCGTCLVEVQQGYESLPPPDADEQELLEVLTDHPRARLACQLDVRCGIQLKPIGQ